MGLIARGAYLPFTEMVLGDQKARHVSKPELSHHYGTRFSRNHVQERGESKENYAATLQEATMSLGLVSHVNRDGDILEAWFRYYCRLGVSSFHLIVHGPKEENGCLYAVKDSYPIVIEDVYQGPFDITEKTRRLNSLLPRMRGQWVVLVDSDEFVEFPNAKISTTIRMLRLAGKNALFAPMLQHLTLDGSLDTPEVVEDPFHSLPLCSVDLYQRMGVQADIRKFPLFYCTDGTTLQEGGNHSCPIGNLASSLQGVTHHFKFRRSVYQRLESRIHSSHRWRHESVQFQEYLASNANRVPTEGAFPYSRAELFRRELLRQFTFVTGLRYLRGITARIHSGKNARA